MTEDYAKSVDKPNVSGLSKLLGVSRQCIYDWSLSHPDFRVVLNNMRHGAIHKIHLSEGKFSEKKILAKKKRKNKSKDQEKHSLQTDYATMKLPVSGLESFDIKEDNLPDPPKHRDELGSDEDWVFDD